MFSCLIQKDNNSAFVSDSPHAHSLKYISELAVAIDENEFILQMEETGFEVIHRDKHSLFHEKEFIRLDFKKIDKIS